jgi:predicted DNA-binding transcriptional regulator AlpA
MKPTFELVVQPIAVDSDTAAAMLGGISRSTFLERVSRGTLPRPRKIGARSVWLVEELIAAARALPLADDLPKACSTQEGSHKGT